MVDMDRNHFWFGIDMANETLCPQPKYSSHPMAHDMTQDRDRDTHLPWPGLEYKLEQVGEGALHV